jgi:hypothetical protein
LSRDHTPPHFHTIYAEAEAEIAIATLETIDGKLPRRDMALVLEWAALYRSELWSNWEKARMGLPLDKIDPLE